ncbi:daptide-type RiPP biosynthesis aminotransferase [Georgenia faecalis]|uniref:Daptide-type RiPP biosynthesis aminotransferase n=1 Tax=Georgenia faecalis TaxID=2483799 RepID=A0ABV9DD17_9MICO|nr:daptide-type RiPP biosynthesis aminotransferase [Georgenia faecalis]
MNDQSRRSALWPALVAPADHGRSDLCATGARGVRVRYDDGTERLCGTSGLWNTPLGYGNEAITQAAAAALTDASYLGVFRYENAYARRAADALVEVAGPAHYQRVMFSTSGGAANDLVTKIVRHYQLVAGRPRRAVVVGLRSSYHGLTFGSFALTGDDLGQALYRVDQRYVRHVTPNRIDELDELMRRQGDQIAAVVVEPVLGTGALPLERAFVDRLLAHRRTHGYLLVADEVATGFGRTGPFFASAAWSEQPDLLVTSKGLTNGTMAAAAVLLGTEVAEALEGVGAVVSHAETQAGTPPTCAAILATLAEFTRLDAIARGHALGASLDARLARLVEAHPLLESTTGVGLFRALRVRTPQGAALPDAEVPALVGAVRAEGAVVHPGPAGIQLLPALVYTEDELDELVDAVARGLDRYADATRREGPAGLRPALVAVAP